MYVALGPTVGAVITILLTESLRVMVGVELAGLDGTIYGLMLILFIIFMPRGIVGTVWSRSAESLNVPKDSPS
jgi:branched-chain amino acid transport system permease protein